MFSADLWVWCVCLRWLYYDEFRVLVQDDQFLPPPMLSWNETQTRFRRFGLSDTEIIAFFGAHAVGRAEYKNSALADGGWVVTQSSFAPTYLRALLRRTWTNMNAPYTNVSAASLVWTNADVDPTHVRCPHTLRFYMACMQLRLSSPHIVFIYLPQRRFYCYRRRET